MATLMMGTTLRELCPCFMPPLNKKDCGDRVTQGQSNHDAKMTADENIFFGLPSTRILPKVSRPPVPGDGMVRRAT
jgi:hypothetical protein